MEQNNHPTAADATVDHDVHAGLLEDLLARVASCFARRDTRLTCRDMVNGLLCELDDYNCWTLAEAQTCSSWSAISSTVCRASI